jgi:hypothetical protein
MTVKERNRRVYPDKDSKWRTSLLQAYFESGEGADAFALKYGYQFGISTSGMHHLLDNCGIIKEAGPSKSISSALFFITRMIMERVPLESLYRKAPESFRSKISKSTLHRIYQYIKSGLTRRAGTALVITPLGKPRRVLIGTDVSTPRPDYGKPLGSLSLPMGFALRREPAVDSVKRVIQREVFTTHTIEGRLLPILGLRHPKSFMDVDVMDTRVQVFHMSLPPNVVGCYDFSSFKLIDYHFIDVHSLSSGSEDSELRAGLPEIARGYINYLEESNNGNKDFHLGNFISGWNLNVASTPIPRGISRDDFESLSFF